MKSFGGNFGGVFIKIPSTREKVESWFSVEASDDMTSARVFIENYFNSNSQVFINHREENRFRSFMSLIITDKS